MPIISHPLVKSRWFKTASIFVVLCLVVLFATPHLARYLAQQWLLENGGDQVVFGDVDLNLFTGNLVLERLEVKVDNETTLSFDYAELELAFWPLLSQQVDVQSLQLKGSRLVIDSRDPQVIRVGGIRIPETPADSERVAQEPSAWLSGIETLSLQDFNVLIHDSKLELDIAVDNLHLTRLVQWAPEQAALLEFTGSVNGARVESSGQLAPFAKQPHYQLELTVEKLQLAAFDKLAVATIDRLSGLLSYAGKIKLETSENSLKASQDGEVVVEALQLALKEPGAEISIERFSHAGQLGLEQSGAALSFNEEGGITVAALRLAIGEAGLETSVAKFSHDGKLGFEQSAATLGFSEVGEIAVESLRLALAEAGLETSISRFSHDGKLSVDQSEGSLKLSHDGKSGFESLVLVRPGMETSVAKFSHDGTLGFEQADTTLGFSEVGEIAVESLRLALAEVGLETSIGEFSHDGKLNVDQSEGSLKLNHEGKSGIESLVLAQPGIETSVAKFSHDGKLGFEQSAATLGFSEAGEIAVESLRLALDEAGIETSIGQLAHNGKLGYGQSGEQVSLEQDGAVSLGLLDLKMRQPAVEVQNGKLELSARFNYSDSPSGVEMQLASDISVEKLDVMASEPKVNLVSVQSLKIEELLLQAVDQLSVKTIGLEQLQLGKVSGEDAAEAQPLVRSDKLQVAGLSRSGKLFAIDSVEFDGLHSRNYRGKDGDVDTLRFIDLIENLNAPVASTDQTDKGKLEKDSGAEQADPVDLVIGSIRVSEGSSVSFIDDKVEPPFATTMVFKEISLAQLDARKPEQKSQLRIEGAIGKHTRLSLSGELQPFLKQVNLELTGQIQALDLPVLSSYTWESLGLLLDSGTLDADLKLVSKDDILDGKVELVMHQLELGKIDTQAGLQSNIPVSLSTALSTLRDENNTIKLTIPVEGNMNDPKFDPSDAINKVLATALKSGALGYLQFALQPFGALIAAAQYAGEAATRVQLNPVEFEAGQAVLTATSEEYLAKVAKVMQERPEINIKLCGVAVQQDLLVMQQQEPVQEPLPEQPQQPAVGDTAAAQPAEQLSAMDGQKLAELSAQRADGVKDYLIEKFQVPASRLVGCRARTEIDKLDAKPRTDLLI